MSVPLSIDHRIRMLIWGWAVQGFGLEDIIVKLRQNGHYVEDTTIWEIMLQAQKVKR